MLITLFAIALVILPFLFWYQTWFGRRLTDEQIERYLSDEERPRRAQHALVQIGERMSQGDKRVHRWYPRIIALASSPVEELRQTVAWILGQDPRHEPFQDALLGLLQDVSPMVRRNAALGLAAFGDSAARPVLMEMLRPSTITAPAAGRVLYRLKLGDYVNPGTLVGRVNDTEVRASLPGEVRAMLQSEGATVSAGYPIVDLSPDENHAWEALRALYLVGEGEDIEEVQRYARGAPGMSPKLKQQAVLTLERIVKRSEK